MYKKNINYNRHYCVLEYPRSGGNWLLKMLSAYLKMPYRDLDRKPETLQEKILYYLFNTPKIARFNQQRTRCPFSYIIKTHLFLGHKYKKNIYCIRDGRDVLVSYYYYQKDFVRKYDGLNPPFPFNDNLPDRAQFFRYLKYRFSTNDYPYLNWTEHLEKALGEENFIFIKYEDLKKDTFRTFVDLLHQLGVSVNHGRAKIICEEQSFENQKRKLKQIDHNLSLHLRRGEVGRWTELFTEKSYDYFIGKAEKIMKQLGYYV